MERLTERMIGGEAQPNCSQCKHYKQCGDEYYCDDNESCYEKIFERLAELEDKLENGQLIESPCKVGDKCWVYADGTKPLDKPLQYTVEGIELRSDGFYLSTIFDMRFKFKEEAVLTKNEAEVRLKELRE